MDRAHFEANQVDRDDKTLKGLQNDGIEEFDCADCGKALLILQLTSIKGEEEEKNTVKVLTRIAVKCKECGGFSYVKSIAGHFHPGATSDKMAFDVLDDDTGAPDADVLFVAWNK